MQLAEQYARALYLATRGTDDTHTERAVRNLTTLLRTRGHLSILPRIAREYARIERVRLAHTGCELRVASASDAQTHAARITQDVHALKAGDQPIRTTLDPSLIGGYELRARGERIDRTYKRALINLYEQLITRS